MNMAGSLKLREKRREKEQWLGVLIRVRITARKDECLYGQTAEVRLATFIGSR